MNKIAEDIISKIIEQLERASEEKIDAWYIVVEVIARFSKNKEKDE